MESFPAEVFGGPSGQECCEHVGGIEIMETVYLSRRNLLSLLSKLDRAAAGERTERTIIKNDNANPEYPQTMEMIAVVAIEDADYYTDRQPGEVHPADIPMMKPPYEVARGIPRQDGTRSPCDPPTSPGLYTLYGWVEEGPMIAEWRPGYSMYGEWFLQNGAKVNHTAIAGWESLS